ncbi:MAG TPA: hypothetical protein VFH25_09540, partial [Nitrososphaeraceae archaeon]|nr:hypothetical protein [Nitrososphaeraceae archaeon]
MICEANRRMEPIRVSIEKQQQDYFKYINRLFRIFTEYIKTRTAPIYCFPVATFITVILGAQGNIDPFLVISTVIGSYF